MHTLKLFTLKLLKMFRHVSIIRSSSASCLFLAKITLLKTFTAWFSYNSLAMWQHVVLCRSSVIRSAPDTVSSFLRLLPHLLVTSICPFIFPSITCCRRQFLRKMWPIQLAFRFLISCRIFLCSLTLINTSPFSHDRSNWSSPSFSSTTFQNFSGVSDLLPGASKFQHRTLL